MPAPLPSKLDERQILQNVHDEATGTLRTTSQASISNVSIAVDLLPSEDGVYIADKDTGDKLVVNPTGSINTVIEDPAPSLRFDEVSASVMYLAEGLYGALDSEAKWKIKKIEITGSLVSIKNASTDFNQVWNNRTGLSYS